MIYTNTIGIDLGGTNIRGGVVNGRELKNILSERINVKATAEEIVLQLFTLTENLITDSVTAIGIGVPGLVDEERGMVFDVINIPAWTELPLKQLMEERFRIPVLINKDAN